ncbi:MAG: hypothetical protein IID63_07005 [candidate division Zixibacteria bacterium]|nr:hypothetical protein [candidate division Zixibacteria bacterium]
MDKRLKHTKINSSKKAVPLVLAIGYIFVSLLLSSQAFAFNPKGQTVTFSDFSFIRDIASTNGRVFFATTGGLIVYNKFSESWEEPLTGKYGIDDYDIRRVWADHFGQDIYIQSSTELFKYDSLVERWYQISELPQLLSEQKVVAPPKVMFAPKGFNYLNDGQLVDQEGRYYSFNNTVEDATGTLWIGTWGLGAATASGTSGHIDLLPYGLIQNRVNAILMDEEFLWLAGAIIDNYRSGITIFDPEYNEFEHIESGLSRDFPALDINCLASNQNFVFAGSELGIMVFDRQTLQPVDRLKRRDGLTDENVLSLAIRGDSIFAGTASGLNLILPATDSQRVTGPAELFGQIIYDLELVDTTLWIAASRGAYRWFFTTGKLQLFQDPHLIIFSKCLAIERWQEFLWLASSDGLLKLNLKTGETEPYRSVTIDRNYRALAVNDTIAVASSSLGFTMLFHDNPKPYTREFTTDDGLPSSYIFELKFEGDYLWIGSDKGLTRFLWNNPSRVD